MPKGTAESPREQALRCRRLASVTLDQRVARTLFDLAAEYEQKAKAIEQETGS